MIADSNNSSINTIKNDEEILESDQSDSLSSKSTNKVIQNFMRCIGALILHVENALSTSNGPVIVKYSSKIKSNDGNDIDIVEHKIKEDPEDTKNHLHNVKKYVLQLCLLFIQDNICIDCDLTFNKIDFYSCLDDSTRSLVINYLTEHVEYLIEHIGFIINMLTEETSKEDAKDIRKSLSKIYKQILLIPLNPNLDETPAVFKNLNSSLWYEESIQHLSEKLVVLRTSLIKLKKAFKRRNLVAANSDVLKQTPTKRKNNSDIDTPNTKKGKLSSPDNVFLLPDIPLSPKKNDINTEKRKINKHKTKSGTSGDEISIVSDKESIKVKKKHKGKDEVKENGIVTTDSDTESIKKKKKRKINSENKEHGITIVPSDTESIKRKIKHKMSIGNEENGKIIIHSDTESVKRKKKHKMGTKNEENETVIVHSETESVKKKKKNRINPDNKVIIVDNDTKTIKKKHKMNKENGTIIVNNDSKSITKKKKLKINKENGIIIVDSDAQPNKKKNKSKINIENKENDTIIVGNDTELIKKKKKHKINNENEIIIVDNGTEAITKKKKPKINKENGTILVDNDAQPIKKKNKTKINIENKENETIIVDNDTESITNKKKHKRNKENGTIIVDNDPQTIRKKNKSKINTENETIIVDNDTESFTKKKTLKINKENGTIIVDNDAQPIKKKNKSKINIENETIIVDNDTESFTKKKKLKINRENGTIIVESDTELIKKKKKHINPENSDNDLVIIASDADSVKRKKKIKFKNQENNTKGINDKDKFKKKSELTENRIISENCETELKEKENKLKIQMENQKNKLISKESDTESVKSKKNLKSNSEINVKEIILETSNSKTQKEKHEKKEENCDTKKQKRNKNESESSIISIGQLFTSQIEIGDKEISFNDKELDTTEEQENNFHTEEHDMSQEIFDALSRGELQVDSEDESVNYLNKITREKELNENERFIFIQDLLLQAKEKNELPEEMKKKLSSLTVLIDWNVPPSHEIITRLTMGATTEELQALKDLNISDKKFNKDEDNTIRRNWEEFCKSHDWVGGPTPFLKFRHGKYEFLKYEERKRFVQYLGKGLPHRILPSVYKRFKTIYRDKSKLGRFTPEEDKLILTYCDKITCSEHRFAELANILNRDRPAIERRYRVLKQHYNIPVKWTILVESQLVSGLLKTTCSKDINDLRDAKITIEHYKQVASALQIPWQKVRIHWLKYIYTKLYASEPLNTSNIRSKLIELLTASGVTDWMKIDWDEIKKSFDGFTKEFLWGQMMSIRVQNVPSKYRNDLGAVLKYLKKFTRAMEEKGSNPYPNKLIKRYKMFDGSLDTFE